MKKSTDALLSKAEKYSAKLINSQKALDSLLEGVQIIDNNWRYVYVNDTQAAYEKTTKEKLLGFSMIERHPAILQTEFFTNLKQCVDDQMPRRFESEFVYPDKSKRWLEISVLPVDEGICILSLDITLRKAAEQRILTNNNLIETSARARINASQEPAVQSEEKGERVAELMIANAALAFQNNAKEEREIELIMANKKLASENEEREKRAVELIIANKKLAFQNEEKEKRAVELTHTIQELAIQNGEKEKRETELIIANNDVTERTTQLESVNKELESFSYSVSHDLRAPLRAINGYARMLGEDYDTLFDKEAKRLLQEIQNNAQRMGLLIDDLLSFSRLGKTAIKKSVVDMNKLIDGVLSEMKLTMPDHVTIKFNALLPAMADQALLVQVMTNLLSNALKYSAKNENAIIEISSKKEDGMVIYSIQDNGVGFDMQYVHKLFGVFQRLHSSEEFSGTGVGLAIVQRIIHKHEGKIWAEGKVGAGATFFFSLPEVIKL